MWASVSRKPDFLQQIMEIIIHVGQYAEWPAMAHAIIQFAEVLKEDEAKAKQGK